MSAEKAKPANSRSGCCADNKFPVIARHGCFLYEIFMESVRFNLIGQHDWKNRQFTNESVFCEIKNMIRRK